MGVIDVSRSTGRPARRELVVEGGGLVELTLVVAGSVVKLDLSAMELGVIGLGVDICDKWLATDIAVL